MAVPLEIPLIQYPTPNPDDRILVEVVDTLKGPYLALHPGDPHSNTREYPNFVFVQQVAIEGTETKIRRIWVNDRAAQDTYNASLGFEAEANAFPNFLRTYLARRLTYAPLTKLAALTGVVGVNVTAGGTSYALAPVITFTGGAGSGAAATAVVNHGALVAIYMTAEGTGYTSAPAVVITPASGGSGATATALIQPTTAILTKEKAERMEGDPHDSLFLKVTRYYETLPGPHLIDIVQADEAVPGSFAYVEHYKVASNTSIPANSFEVRYTRQVIDSCTLVEKKETRAFLTDSWDGSGISSFTFTFYKSQSFSFPQLFNSYFSNIYGVFAKNRSSFSINVPHKFVIGFSKTAQEIAPDKIIEATWTVFSWSGHGLTNEDSYNAYLPDGTAYGFNLPPSTPTRTAYNAWIGTYRLVDGDSVPFGDVFMNTRIYVKMQ